MNIPLVIALVIIFLFVFGALFVRNPKKTQSFGKTSVGTCTYLGKRGDMGNQLFQVAATLAAGRRSEAEVVLPTRTKELPLSQLFDLSSLKFEDLSPQNSFREYDNFEHIVLPDDGKVYDINGYRQSYKYFEDYSDEVRKLFTPRRELLEKVKAQLPEKYIAVHIRRGDYIKKIHSVPLLKEFSRCELEFFKAGVKRLRKSFPECPVLVCTDSPDWAKRVLHELDQKAVLAPVVKGVKPKFSDFCVLYLSDGLVLSNSTYSWWAAYLRPGRPVVVPSPWWDPAGFIGTSLGLNGPYLYLPEWTVLNCKTGKPEKVSEDTNSDTLSLYKFVRGILL